MDHVVERQLAVELAVEGGGACRTVGGAEVEVAESLRAGRSSHVWRGTGAVKVEVHGSHWYHNFHLHYRVGLLCLRVCGCN